MNHEDLNTLLEEWHRAKQEISVLEAKCDKYKKCAAIFLDNEGVDIVNGDAYKLQRRNISRDTISKKDLPSEIWNRYSSRNNYSSYYITKRK